MAQAPDETPITARFSSRVAAGFELAHGPYNAVRGPLAKFRIVLGVSAHAGNQWNAVCRRVMIQPAERRNQPFGSSYIETAGRKQEIDLRVDVEECGLHA